MMPGFGRQYGAVRLGAVTSFVVLGMAMNVLKAEENKAFVAGIAQPQVESRAADFNFLWGGVRDAFVLDGEGVVRTNPEGSVLGHFDQEDYHIGDISTAFSDPVSAMGVSVSDAFPNDEDYDYSNVVSVESVDLAVPECGPSPLAGDEIRRMVGEAARQYGVDPRFAQAVAYAESNFDVHRNSPKGARGPMQLTPAAAERLSVADVCDPAANIDGGVRYLRALLDEFQNPIYAAAAYNAGPQRIYEYDGIPPFRETVEYLAKVLNFQLGPLEPGQAPDAAPVSPEAGVIQHTTPGTFVGGVMHF